MRLISYGRSFYYICRNLVCIVILLISCSVPFHVLLNFQVEPTQPTKSYYTGNVTNFVIPMFYWQNGCISTFVVKLRDNFFCGLWPLMTLRENGLPQSIVSDFSTDFGRNSTQTPFLAFVLRLSLFRFGPADLCPVQKTNKNLKFVLCENAKDVILCVSIYAVKCFETGKIGGFVKMRWFLSGIFFER